ncbi:MAG: tRNA uridine-5-carboxymethylaminomethyl(34) synthesis GTPase MnmE [Magnetococcales bacterium]|nr:tRNA uridine-5-carboxymethylaminomethyl(34) synthesis GTPase MnmE [Magnetococcales bacterium]
MPKASPFLADPIAGLATPPGRGGVAVVRLSGAGCWFRLHPLLRFSAALPSPPLPPSPPPERKLIRAEFLDADGTPLDHLLVVHFPAPRSFTGEEQVELQGHGSMVVVRRILQRLSEVGIRPAQPGEFSKRACLNGKMNLLQAQAVLGLIEAGTLRGAKVAARQLEGEAAAGLKVLREGLLQVLVHLEARIDFADEEIDPLEREGLVRSLRQLSGEVARLVRGMRLGQRLQEGYYVVVVGRPNVGKSSLFNRLAGRERAIVSDQAGTTRDSLEVTLERNGLLITLVDTAGLRHSDCHIEAEGMRRTREHVRQADAVLLVAEAHRGVLPEDFAILAEVPAALPRLWVWNKMDLLGDIPPSGLPEGLVSSFEVLPVSCHDGSGLAKLEARLEALSNQGCDEVSAPLMVAARHQEHLERLSERLQEALREIEQEKYEEIAAWSLREGALVLGDMVGEIVTEEILEGIFSRFCIGK